MNADASVPTAQVTLKTQRIFEKPGHCWVYAGHLGQVEGKPGAGDLIDVLMPSGRFYGRGFFNPFSKISVRILTFEREPIDERFWTRRFQQAIRLRERVVSQSNAYRLIYG
ncbi:MAG TPA: hypothetical protein VD738_09120, partial [Nitrospira sp.]|nr:hypothetical protein [Nitrospira sp.]